MDHQIHINGHEASQVMMLFTIGRLKMPNGNENCSHAYEDEEVCVE